MEMEQRGGHEQTALLSDSRNKGRSGASPLSPETQAKTYRPGISPRFTTHLTTNTRQTPNCKSCLTEEMRVCISLSFLDGSIISTYMLHQNRCKYSHFSV